MAYLSKSIAAWGCGLLCLLLARSSQAVPSTSKAVVEQASDADDLLALIQQKMEPRHRRSAAGAPSLAQDASALQGQASAAAAANFTPYIDPKDCAYVPAMCAAPFECQKTSNTAMDTWAKVGWATDGKPNWRSWCLDARYEPYAGRCASGDIVGAGLVQYQLTTAGVYGPDVAELDASFCFMDGACVNTAITNSTTADDMVQMCDERFGRETWAYFGAEDAPLENRVGYGLEELHEDYSNGFSNQKQTRPYMLMSCAMGNYHCDIMYCKNYCQNDYYKNKYGHLLKENGWVP